MKSKIWLSLVILLNSYLSFAATVSFESIADSATRSQYTVCDTDSLVKRDCITLQNSDVGLSLSNPRTTSKRELIRENSYTGANAKYVNPNDVSYDKNAIANFNITNANQTLMQAYSPDLNPEFTPTGYVIERVTIPFKTTENSTLNVGANKIEFNLSY